GRRCRSARGLDRHRAQRGQEQGRADDAAEDGRGNRGAAAAAWYETAVLEMTLSSPTHGVIPAKVGISVCWPSSQQQKYGPGVARLFAPFAHDRSVTRDSRSRGNDPAELENLAATG